MKKKWKPARLSLPQSFFLLSAGTLVCLGLILGKLVTYSLERSMVSRAIEITARFVTDECVEEFSPGDFRAPKTGAAYDEFAQRVARTSLVKQTPRIKFWSVDHTVVWSDDPRLVGQQFADNEELREALGGRIESEISALGKEENQFEDHFGRLLELYIPLRFSPGAKVEAVAEVYQNLDPLFADISRLNGLVWLSIAGGLGVLHLALSGFVWRAARRIEAQRRQLEHSEERYRSLVSTAQDGIFSVDQRGCTVLFNEAAARLFGRAPSEVIGRSLSPLVPDCHRAKHEQGILRYQETGEASLFGRTVELEGLRQGGDRFPMELSLSVCGTGRDRTVTGFVRDISERKELQRQLIMAERQASAALVAGSIGHELNNSVTALLGYADMLTDTPGDSELASKCGEVFSSQCQRLALHAQNLLGLSRPRTPVMRRMMVQALVERVTEMLVVSGVLKRYRIVKRYAQSLPPVVADEALLEQVVRNLLINAAHAMGDSGCLTVETAAAENGPHVEFRVADTGHGIPEDKKDEIFRPFFTTKEEGKGTGLGLYICRQIVNEHCGYIRVESELGAGTTMAVGLPAVGG